MAERLGTLEEILKKMDGKCVAQYKYDGLRVQSHISPSQTILFSRRQENITSQFPDIVRRLNKSVEANEAILDGEAVPIDPETGALMPFQTISQRRGRKYNIEKMTQEVPVALCLFDILYKNGEDLTLQPYLERRRLLSETITPTERIRIAEDIVSDNTKEIESFFDQAIQEGTEGLICKSTALDAVYEAGHRGWRWIKWKRSYRSEMTDTVDLVAIGAYAGKGRRAGTYGALLMAAYDLDKDEFFSVTKLGSGFTDKDLDRFSDLFEPYLIPKKHPRVNSLTEADFWLVPAKVFEIIGDEITLSPIHTCGFDAIRKGSGLAIRFPRLVKARDDRNPEDATTVDEIIKMYKLQLKKI
jgi:DNA ligase-1